MDKVIKNKERVPVKFKDPRIAYKLFKEKCEEIDSLHTSLVQMTDLWKQTRKCLIKQQYEKKLVKEARKLIKNKNTVNAKVDFLIDLEPTEDGVFKEDAEL